MSEQIVKDHTIEALKVAASWPGAARPMLVTLATVLAATGGDEEASGTPKRSPQASRIRYCRSRWPGSSRCGWASTSRRAWPS